MTDEQLQRIHDIEYSCDSRAELAERIVALEDEVKRLQTCVLVLSSDLEDWKGQYDPTDTYVRKAQEENAKLRELVDQMYREMQGALDMSTDTVFVDSVSTLRDMMDIHMQVMADLGMPPTDYFRRMREL